MKNVENYQLIMDDSHATTSLRIEIPFKNSRTAEIALHTLRVDSEPKRGGTTKILEIDGSKLIALFFGLYLIWAIVPESHFRSLGITCLPHRYWAISVPIFLLTAFAVSVLVIYPSLGLCMTPDINDLRTIKDEIGCKKNDKMNKLLSPKIYDRKDSTCCSNIETCHKEKYNYNKIKSDHSKSIPVLKDLDISEVSRELYLDS